ncbi:conserved hypothetical protein [Gammaproteobacteria bacterium]
MASAGQNPFQAIDPHDEVKMRIADTYTEGDLDRIVANFSSNDRAAHTIGHDSPFAFGWVEGLRRTGELLEAKTDPATLSAEFSALLDSGKLANRSVRLVNGGENGWRLGHIAWLGAEPPAVQNLSPLRADHAAGEVCDFSLYGPTIEDTALAWALGYPLTTLARNLREWLIAKYSIEDADQVVPSWLGDQLAQIRDTPPESDESSSSYSAAVTTMPQSPEDAARISALEAELAAANAQLKTAAEEGRKRDYTAKVEAMILAGKLTPAESAGLVDKLMKIPVGESGTADFSASGAGTVLDILDKLPTKIHLGPYPNQPATGTTGSGHSADFSAPAGFSVDPDAAALHSNALAYQREHPGVGYLEAVRAVTV